MSSDRLNCYRKAATALAVEARQRGNNQEKCKLYIKLCNLHLKIITMI